MQLIISINMHDTNMSVAEMNSTWKVTLGSIDESSGDCHIVLGFALSNIDAWCIVVYIQEPTSGLDSATACSLMSTLDTYARLSDKTIITSIHQPSSQIFHMFTHLLLLVDGQVRLIQYRWCHVISRDGTGSRGHRVIESTVLVGQWVRATFYM